MSGCILELSSSSVPASFFCYSILKFTCCVCLHSVLTPRRSFEPLLSKSKKKEREKSCHVVIVLIVLLFELLSQHLFLRVLYIWWKILHIQRKRVRQNWKFLWKHNFALPRFFVVSEPSPRSSSSNTNMKVNFNPLSLAACLIEMYANICFRF